MISNLPKSKFILIFFSFLFVLCAFNGVLLGSQMKSLHLIKVLNWITWWKKFKIHIKNQLNENTHLSSPLIFLIDDILIKKITDFLLLLVVLVVGGCFHSYVWWFTSKRAADPVNHQNPHIAIDSLFVLHLVHCVCVCELNAHTLYDCPLS